MAVVNYKALQESASALYKSVTPILQRLGSFKQSAVFSPEARRATQQAENLKWQQEMFHRLFNLVCLFNEGIVPSRELVTCRSEIISTLESMHQEGEWAEFTRDKLLFLQDLLFAGCISEEEYHNAKRPLILRLAEQGAELDAKDVIFGGSSSPPNNVLGGKESHRSSRTPTKANLEGDIASNLSAQPTEDRISNRNSPMKQVIEAMTRLKSSNSRVGRSTTPKEKEVARVPHALDFIRPKNCPVRDPPSPLRAVQRPLEDDSCSPLDHIPDEESSLPHVNEGATELINPFSCMGSPIKPTSTHAEPLCKSPWKSPSVSASPPHFKSQGKTGSRVREILTGLISKVQGEYQKTPQTPDSSSDESDTGRPKEEVSKTTWGFELLRPPKRLEFGEPAKDDKSTESSSTPKIDLTEHRILREGTNGQGPNTVRLKKKIHSKGAPTDFFIDKVLGENIKNELSRIRTEMNNTSSGQTQPFTNEQIDAIATRLPADKTELKRFFPKSWCDRYGDIVLEVVHKEFKQHVGEMDSLRRAAREKRMRRMNTDHENDENKEVSSQPGADPKLAPKSSPLNKCFTTTMDENNHHHHPNPTFASQWQQQQQGGGKLTPRRARIYSRDMGLDYELDGKLGEEIEKMPLRRTTNANECGSHLRV